MVFKILVGTRVGESYHFQFVWCGIKKNAYLTSQCKEPDWDTNPELQKEFTTEKEADKAIKRLGLRELFDSVELVTIQSESKVTNPMQEITPSYDSTVKVEMTLEEKAWFLKNFPNRAK